MGLQRASGRPSLAGILRRLGVSRHILHAYRRRPAAGRATVQLEPGDVVVWLSDGLIEAPGPDGQPFGYEATLAALHGPCAGAHEVRDRLLDAIAKHAGATPPEDDRTLVVMEWRGVVGGEAGDAAEGGAKTVAVGAR